MKNNNLRKVHKTRNRIFLIMFLAFFIPSLVSVSESVKELFSSLSFGSNSTVEKKSAIPAKLRWFDPFGDINNTKKEN